VREGGGQRTVSPNRKPLGSFHWGAPWEAWRRPVACLSAVARAARKAQEGGMKVRG
jgi:hypothetical protein